jgi:tRNA(Ile)-lysidine synthase
MPAAEADPQAAVSRWIDRLRTPAALLLAVSGGSDSTALLHLFAEAAAQRTGIALFAATVDHGLRAGSAEEARSVAALCASLGIGHEILTWQGPKPASGLQDAARRARYGLLRDAAKRRDAIAILTGHTLDDQIETVAMRRARSSPACDDEAGEAHDGGLAGMAEATLFMRDCWLMRPLLRSHRQELRGFLECRGFAWFDDPSNADPRFERARLRLRDDAPAIDTADIDAARAARIAHMAARAGFLARNAVAHDDAALVEIRLDGGAGTALAVSSLCDVATLVGGTVHAAGRAQQDALAAFLRDPVRRRFALSRCLFEKMGRSTVVLMREARDLPEIVVAPGGTAAWDRRFVIANRDPSRHLRVFPARAPGAVAGGEDAAGTPWRGPGPTPRMRRAAATTMPAFRFDGEERTAALSELSSQQRAVIATERLIVRYDTFLPAFDVMLADVLAGLVGRAPYGGPPVIADGSP